MTDRIQSIFISHGAPTFALEPGAPGEALSATGKRLLAQGTQALIVLSPHWRSSGLEVSTHEAPVVVHDFYGFPAPLYKLKPEISGAPRLAEAAIDALNTAGFHAKAHAQQGFDHGAWVPYMHLFPNGGPRMIQVSMPIDMDNQSAYALGKQLGMFAQQHHAVVVGSGSLTHNFNDMDLGDRLGSRAEPDNDELAYVRQFTTWITHQLTSGHDEAVLKSADLAPGFLRAHPDDDHFLPLPFAMGAASAKRQVHALPEDVRYRALSMQSFVFSSH